MFVDRLPGFRTGPRFEERGLLATAPAAGPREGSAVGRRGIKEYRASEALNLIAADRDRETLVCPSCESSDIERIPRRSPRPGQHEAGRVTLHCRKCGRSAVYLAGAASPERPRSGHNQPAS